MNAKITRALLSVSDKTGLVDFARALQARGIEILSTGGTAAHLKENGIKLREVSDYTGFPEIMDGRVKTLQPKIHGGLLADRDNAAHRKAMDDHGIGPIDLLVVNLYPFQDTVNKGADRKTCIENIDIGGPAMIRAAAKNHAHVGVVIDPADYPTVLADLETHAGSLSETLKQSLASKAFALTAAYDSAIAGWLNNNNSLEIDFPQNFTLAGTLVQTLRYGENPHQKAALYLRPDDLRPGAARARQLQGKELSFNNINDTDAAFNLVCEFAQPACVIVKHANPCGVALDDNLASAYEKAKACDPVSAFGGIIAFNRPLDAPAAQAVLGQFAEVIIAPAVLPEALSLLAQKPNVRVLMAATIDNPFSLPNIKLCKIKTRIQPLTGGFLVQTEDDARITEQQLKTVTKRAPTPQEIADMLFAFTVAKHVKSNAIVYAQSGMTMGIGAGQMSRVDSSRIAAWKMAERCPAAQKSNHQSPTPDHLVLASDAFFPFADGLIAAAEAGVTAVIQPGGSIRDAEVIAAADERGLAMVFTGVRHFRH